jgi:hypothetical protein
MKTPVEESLRGLVEKWLAPEGVTPVRVTAFGRTRIDGARYVCVEAQSRNGVRALYFFRHSDGSWRVYPPISAPRASRDTRAGRRAA